MSNVSEHPVHNCPRPPSRETRLVAKRSLRTHPWQPLFAFGYGLSYTSFELGTPVANMTTLPAAAALDTTLRVSVTVRNVGARAGKTAVAVYHSRPLSSFVRYHKMLAAFAKTPALVPGQQVTMEIDFNVARALSTFNATSGTQTVEAGVFELSVGQDSVAMAPGGPLKLEVTNG